MINLILKVILTITGYILCGGLLLPILTIIMFDDYMSALAKYDEVITAYIEAFASVWIMSAMVYLHTYIKPIQETEVKLNTETKKANRRAV